MKPRITGFALLAFLAAATGVCAEDLPVEPDTAKAEDYSISVRTDNLNYRVGKRVKAVVKVMNITDQDIKIVLTNGDYRFSVTKDGCPIPSPKRWRSDSLIAKEGRLYGARLNGSFFPFILKPFQERENSFIVNIWADLSKPGKYEVVANVTIREYEPQKQSAHVVKTAPFVFSLTK